MKTIRGNARWVTGAASGIGRAIALALARRGPIFTSSTSTRINWRAWLPRPAPRDRVEGAVCDLARPEEITAAVKTLLQCWGHLDILVNNAGVSFHGKTKR